MRQALSNSIRYAAIGALSAGCAYVYLSRSTPPQPILKAGAPILTTAGIVHICPSNKIALVERGKNPLGLAMFGGHVEAFESPEQAFRRELHEELNISKIDALKLIGVHGTFGRDPRQHSVEVTYMCTTSQVPYAGSDAKSIAIYTPEELIYKLNHHPSSFAFDHSSILKSYLKHIGNCNPCNTREK